MSDEFAALNAARLDEFRVEHYDAAEEALLILASRDFSYYVDAEIRFTGVEHIAVPTYFCDALFRDASGAEVAELRRLTEWEDSKRVFCVVADAAWAAGERRHFVVAAAVTVRVERRRLAASHTPPAP